jgi:hypothetical protein
MENPYTSPQSDPRPTPVDDGLADPAVLRLARIGEVAVAWEKLRLWYNLVLSVVALISISLWDARLLTEPRALEMMILAALAANACFCAGPLLEGYTTWFFRPVAWLRMSIFGIGTMGAVVLTPMVVAAIVLDHLGGMD